MTARAGLEHGLQETLARTLGAALLAGILVAWTPRYWRVSAAIAALALVGAAWALTAQEVELPRQAILATVIGAWGFLQLALHRTSVPWPTVQSSIEWATGAVSFILGTQILRGDRGRKAFLDLMLWAITALAVAAMLQMYASPGRLFGVIPVASSVVGTLYYKNQFAGLMELAAPIALWKVYDGNVVAGGLCYAAMFAATLSSASRAGVILVLAEFLVALVLMVVGRRMPLKSAASLVAMLGVLVVAASLVAGTGVIVNRLREPNAYLLRGTLLKSTLRMIARHPWFGSGMGTWPWEYPGFATYDTGVYVNAAHNDWAQWASDGGIPFLLLLAALTLWLAKPSVQSVWGLGVLSVMVHSLVDYPLREPVLGFFWFALAGGATVMGTSSTAQGPPMRQFWR